MVKISDHWNISTKCPLLNFRKTWGFGVFFLFVCLGFLLLSKSYRQNLSSDGQIIHGCVWGVIRKEALSEDSPEGLHWDSRVSHECRTLQVLLMLTGGN